MVTETLLGGVLDEAQLPLLAHPLTMLFSSLALALALALVLVLSTLPPPVVKTNVVPQSVS